MYRILEQLRGFCEVMSEYDPEKNRGRAYCEERIPEFMNQWMDYDLVMDRYLKEVVYSEDQKQWRAMMSPAALAQLAAGERPELQFRIRFSDERGVVTWNEVFLARMENGHVAVGIRSTDEPAEYESQSGSEVLERRLRSYMENMPLACCSVKVLLDEQGDPYDFVFTYSNRAHARLEGTKPGELIGKRFYEFFRDTSKEWLRYYYETAYLGVPHVIRQYSPEIRKYLLIYTFQETPGSCGCILQDVTEEKFLEDELEKRQERLRYLLSATTVLAFQYDPQEQVFTAERTEKPLSSHEKLPVGRFLKKAVQSELISAEDADRLQSVLTRIADGEHDVSVEMRLRRSRRMAFRWYKLNFFDYNEPGTHERRILGYMQNIEPVKLKQAELEHEATTDPLTGVLNTRAGQRQVKKRLSSVDVPEYHVVCIMDIDDFKSINDTYGHLAGDAALKTFAQILRKTFRTEDIIFRLGGDEFFIYWASDQDVRENIKQIMERFFRNLAELSPVGIELKSSVGIYAAHGNVRFEQCYQEADQALYDTKRNGKNGYTVRIGEA